MRLLLMHFLKNIFWRQRPSIASCWKLMRNSSLRNPGWKLPPAISHLPRIFWASRRVLSSSKHKELTNNILKYNLQQPPSSPFFIWHWSNIDLHLSFISWWIPCKLGISMSPSHSTCWLLQAPGLSAISCQPFWAGRCSGGENVSTVFLAFPKWVAPFELLVLMTLSVFCKSGMLIFKETWHWPLWRSQRLGLYINKVTAEEHPWLTTSEDMLKSFVSLPWHSPSYRWFQFSARGRNHKPRKQISVSINCWKETLSCYLTVKCPTWDFH